MIPHVNVNVNNPEPLGLVPEPPGRDPNDPDAPPPIVAHRLDFVQLGLPEYKHKFAMVIDNVLTPDDCARYLAKVQSQKAWEPAGVGASVTAKTVDASYRHSSRILFDDEALADEMFQKLRPYLDEIAYLGLTQPSVHPPVRLVGLNPRLRFLKYEPGQFFHTHCDGTYSNPEQTQTSYFTLQLYLAEAPNLQGGATRFWKMGDVRSEGRKTRPRMPPLRTWADVEPRTGRALIFEQRGLAHSGERVVEGVKLTVRTDFMFEAWGGE
ncbi:hypothetical protein RSOLAG22IIIB_05248 [Rhizoctonia solani]|uniref:Prolyl 4-hydroxylase alpha subunit domain-containing protein n=1 Tax=Rhizoctonia solani TaxID=456999 RepID=A0A0K6G451_9AGAM|nr:hypothetical protein RSOLAG22IIIB_05248 [Rhizoctonia solani]